MAVTELSVVEQRHKAVLEVIEHGAKIVDVARRAAAQWDDPRASFVAKLSDELLRDLVRTLTDPSKASALYAALAGLSMPTSVLDASLKCVCRLKPI